jgi:PII-like signaling protein
MPTLTRACRLTIHVGNADVEHHQPLAVQILHRAHRAGLAGATTLHGIEGYGHSGTIHETPRWSVVDRTPLIIVIVDLPDRIRAFLPQLDDIAERCLITVDAVEAAVPARH